MKPGDYCFVKENVEIFGLAEPLAVHPADRLVILWTSENAAKVRRVFDGREFVISLSRLEERE